MLPHDPRLGMRPCPTCRSLMLWIQLDGVLQCWWCGPGGTSRPRAGREGEEGVNELAGEYDEQ